MNSSRARSDCDVQPIVHKDLCARILCDFQRASRECRKSVRVRLAASVQESLQRAMPDMVTQQGPLATLDYLADLERS